MKAGLVRWLERRWYGGTPPNSLLNLLESFYTRIVTQRRREFLYGFAGMMRPHVPVIVVGNITVGGAGKTPLTIALVDALRARGFRPGVISRGYGRRASDVRRVALTDAAADVGDEPLLIAHRTGVPVAVAPGRYAAAKLLERSGEVDVLIADDGLQHYSLARDIEILVIDGRRGIGNGRLLPAGPLREPLERAAACDFVVVNAGSTENDGVVAGVSGAGLDALPARAVTMRLSAADAVSLQDGTRTPLTAFVAQRVHAVAGIADPERFFATLRRHGIEPVPHPFPDHHAFVGTDLAFADSAPVLMTEKDAVKCRGIARKDVYSVPVDAILPSEFFDALAARVRATVLTEPSA